MEVQELRPGLWRWSAPHPNWRPGEDWPELVGCVYYEAPDAVVLVDPLVPAGEEEARFWRALDRDVEHAGVPVVVALTAPWHARSSTAVAGRYGACVWPGDPVLPGTIEPLPVPPVEEGQVALFLREHRTLVTAEILAGVDGLTVWPSPSLPRWSDLDSFFRTLLELPIEIVLPSHGDPVVENAGAALAQAVAPSAS